MPLVALPMLTTDDPAPEPDLAPTTVAFLYESIVTDHSPVPFTARATIYFDDALWK